MPKFSIIIPVYNVEKYINHCLESVISQTFQDFEAIVVDDCGSDNSVKIVEKYANNDSRIKIIKHNKNRGLAAARNTALEHSTGDYIICLDSDDWMESNCLQTVFAIFEQQKTTSVWFNAKKYFDNTNSFDIKPMYEQQEGYRLLTPDTIAAFSDFTWIKAYTRESIQKFNLNWPEGLTFEDGEFYFKYFTLNPRTYVINDCLINYRYRDNSIVRNADKGNVQMEHIYEVLRHLKVFWEKLGVYEQYKTTMLKLIQNRIRMCYGLKYSNENKILSYKLLKDLNYPEDFINLNPQNIKQNPLVTVVVPVYNVEKYIEQCIQSIISQTYNNFEVLCIDDCGNDNSMQIITNYAEHDTRIKILKHEKNKGLGAARNTGLKNAKGDFIFFIDADDWIEPYCLQQVIHILKETNYNTVMYKADVFWENSQTRTQIWYDNYKNFPEGSFIIDSSNMCLLPHYSWNKGYRTDFLRKNNIYWQEGLIYEDMEFFFKVFINSPNTYMIDETLYIYRRRDDSIIGQCYNNQIGADDLFKVTKSIHDYLVENNLMSKYQNAYLNLVNNNLNNYRGFDNVHTGMIQKMLKCLDDINFPDEYERE